ncbi:hypothetical protein TNCV_4108781 [Trichonephila clavipes]|nr:hypothetical protein TNCV_4108781 [Trichonephila clavipes]
MDRNTNIPLHPFHQIPPLPANITLQHVQNRKFPRPTHTRVINDEPQSFEPWSVHEVDTFPSMPLSMISLLANSISINTSTLLTAVYNGSETRIDNSIETELPTSSCLWTLSYCEQGKKRIHL